MLSPRDRLIVALDLPTATAARKLADELRTVVSTFKVGLQLFTAAGPDFVHELLKAGHKVFLDLKFHDIPNTVGEAVKSAADLGVQMLTVHAPGGGRMLEAAVSAARKSESPPLVLAVTVLTSLSDGDLQETGVAGRPLDQVLRLAALAKAKGCDGVVASPQEVRELRRELGEGFAIVTPGVRPHKASKADQARTATPSEAIAAGATYIVVGRPISQAPNPRAAAEQILREIAEIITKKQSTPTVSHHRI